MEKLISILFCILILKFDVVYLIINGKLASDGQFPWNTHLTVYTINNKSKIACGGSLISSKWILTAGHCLLKAKLVECELGSVSLIKPNLKITSEKFISHPQFKANTFQRNIGLIELPKEIAFSKTIQPVLLPGYSVLDEDLEGKFCTVSGFGLYDFKIKMLSNTLRYTKVQIIPSEMCLLKNSSLTGDEVICTQGVKDVKNSTTCFGDTGSGLIFNKKNKSYIVGIYSFGSKNCENSQTGYESIEFNLEWIYKTTGLEIDYYDDDSTESKE